ncbi:MAG TPA: hypothetical protein VGK53_09320 [Propionicimonas sp.]
MAVDLIVPAPASEVVLAGAAEERIVGAVAVFVTVAVLAVDLILSGSTAQGVVAVAADDGVVSADAVFVIVAVLAVDLILPGPTAQRVVTVTATMVSPSPNSRSLPSPPLSWPLPLSPCSRSARPIPEDGVVAAPAVDDVHRGIRRSCRRRAAEVRRCAPETDDL